MKIGILSRNGALYSTRRLVQMARLRGHEAVLIDTTAVAILVGTTNSYLPRVEAIIPRIGSSITRYGLAVVRQFESAGIFTTASSQAIAQSRDKLHSLQLMQQHGLPVPRTAAVSHPTQLLTAVRAVGGLPVVMKHIQGTQGQGMVLAQDIPMAVATFAAAYAQHSQILVQEYIAAAAGKDLRLIVVNGRCIAAMERSAMAGDFRANLHQGGTAVSIEPDAQIRQLAREAAQIHQLGVAGVDLLQSSQGPLLLEVNSSPGLKGIEGVTGINVAAAIMQYVEEAVGQPAKKQPARRRR